MKYTIKEVRYSTIRREWLYDVEANSKEEALSKVWDGYVMHSDYEEEEEEDDHDIKSEYEVEETN